MRAIALLVALPLAGCFLTGYEARDLAAPKDAERPVQARREEPGFDAGGPVREPLDGAVMELPLEAPDARIDIDSSLVRTYDGGRDASGGGLLDWLRDVLGRYDGGMPWWWRDASVRDGGLDAAQRDAGDGGESGIHDGGGDAGLPDACVGGGCAQPVGDCDAGAHCQLSCDPSAPNSECSYSCTDAFYCETSCLPGTRCDLTCVDDEFCGMFCGAGSQCVTACMNTRCKGICEPESTCAFACLGGQCNEFHCKAGAHCKLYCQDVANCDMQCDDVSKKLTCPDGSISCDYGCD